MILEKVEKGSIPSEEVTMNADYYVIDAETVETLAYIIEAHDLDAVSKTANDFMNECKNELFKNECKNWVFKNECK